MNLRLWTKSSLSILFALVLGNYSFAQAATTTVQIVNFAFSPAQVTINAGDTVAWVQRDSAPHTSTSDTGVWDSGILSVNQTFSFTFPNAGSFPYHCTVHPFMKGTVTVKAASANVPPTVEITSPKDGQVFPAPANIQIQAAASDSDGSVASVMFFDGTNSIGSVAQPPFSMVLTNAAGGSHVLTARATDNQGASSTSAPVTVQVASPPQLSFSPGNGAVFISPATIILAATASSTGGAIAKVQFLSGTNSLAVFQQPPFQFVLTNVAAGEFQFTATATDNFGLTTAVTARVTVTGAAAFVQENLVSDLPGLAAHQDTHLANPWGIASSSTSPFWISDNHAGVSTLYDTQGNPLPLIVQIPPPNGGMPPSSPTGVLFNKTTDFAMDPNTPSRFIFVTEDGTVAAWASGTNAVLKADNSRTGTIYKGVAMASREGKNFLYAADFHNAKIDVLDANFQMVKMAGAFEDPNLPKGYAPFNVRNFGGNLFVSFALQDKDAEDDVAGPGNGFLDLFAADGKLIRRLISSGPLNAPWGLAVAPEGFGPFGGDLLVGNFGDGTINAFDMQSGQFHGTLSDTNGAPIHLEGLWDLIFGNGGRGGDPIKLYFTAGISGGGQLEDHGLFGSLAPAPAVRITRITDHLLAVTLEWAGGAPPYLVQRKLRVTDTNWMDLATTTQTSITIPREGPTGFFRVQAGATVMAQGFAVSMSGASEVPPVTGSSGTATGFLSIEGNQISYHLTYSGLTGNATAAHIHGPADLSHSAGVLVPLSGAAGTSGVLSGTATLTADQLTAIKTGNAYVNIHTPSNPGGEIRGQIQPFAFHADLNGANEIPPVTTAGKGSGSLALLGNNVVWEISYSNLSANAVAAHVHGPAAPTASAGVLFPLPGAQGTSGVLSGTHLLTPDELTALLGGLTYANIHTTAHGGGEIRGQILPQN